MRALQVAEFDQLMVEKARVPVRDDKMSLALLNRQRRHKGPIRSRRYDDPPGLQSGAILQDHHLGLDGHS